MKYLIYVLSIIWMMPLSAQKEISVEQSDEVYFTRYEAEKSNLQVNDIEIDNNNRIVVATDKLLFSTTSLGDLPKKLLQNTYVKSVAFDNASNIYAAGKNIIYDLKLNTKFYLPDTALTISAIEIKDDKIWVGSDKGLYRYDMTSKAWDEFNSRNSDLRSNKITFVQKDKKDIIWIGTMEGYIKISADGKWELEDKKESISASRSNDEGQWMVSTHDMWLIDPYNRKYPIGLESNMHKGKVNDFVIDSKGRIYMASDILVRYDPYEEKIEQYGSDVGVLSEKCLSLACDKNDNIWLGTADAGMFRMTFGSSGPEVLSATILLENNILCNGSDNASFIISTAGGEPPYTYKWNDGSEESNRRSKLKAGIYSLTVTDALGTEAMTSIEINEPKPIEIEVLEVKNISAKGVKDGQVSVAASGGTGKLNYLWSNGNSGSSLSGIDEGSYILTVKDQNNCAAKKQITIGDAKNIPELTASDFEVGKILTINNLNFQADSSNIMTNNYIVLDEIYEFLNKNKTVVIEIGGHTNTIPPHEYCDRLSTSRAQSVAQYIVDQGIPSERVQYKGYGKRKPLIDSRSLQARKKNQRVEIKILEI